MINVDVFRKMGLGHTFCEDYILSGTTPFNYIILSDGCSSAKNTEMGSRILCYTAKQFLLYRYPEFIFPDLDYYEMGSWIIHNAELTVRHLGLNKSCLNATLLIAYEHKGRYYIYMYGDGIFILKGKNSITITEVNFSPINAPYYLQYKINSADMDIYHKLGQELHITQTIVNNGTEIKQVEKQYAYDYKSVWNFDASISPTLLVCSDGASSFYRNNDKEDAIPLLTITNEFLAYKLSSGEFLQRRLKRMMKLYDKEEIKHYDDLTVGAFIKED